MLKHLPKMIEHIGISAFNPRTALERHMQQLLIISLSVINILAILAHFLLPNTLVAGVINESVTISNVTDQAFSVSWVTDEAVGGALKYGVDAGNLDAVVGDDRGDNFVGHTHHVTVGLSQPLSAETTYFFQIMSDSVMILDSQGQPFSQTTGAALELNQAPALVFGKVLKEAASEVASDSLIYLEAIKPNGHSKQLSTFGGTGPVPVSDGAGWVIALNNLRDVTGARMFTSDIDGTLQLSVNGGIDGRGKLEVAGDTVGQLADISLDKTPPQFGTAAAYSDSDKAHGLDLANWQTEPSPYFEWSDAIDAGYGTRGYYVYFGLDPEADPKTASGKVFQTVTSFNVAASMISGKSYYLLVKTVDNVNNVSSVTKVFTYRFDSRAPSATLEIIGGDLLASSAVRIKVGGSDDGTPADQLNISYSVDGGEFSQFAKSAEINLSDLSEGDHNLVVRIADLAGNIGEIGTTFKVDLTAPAISALDSNSTTVDRAIITWQTNESATTQIKYGQDVNNLDNQTELDNLLSTFHGETIGGLLPDTTYFFEVMSADSAGNLASLRSELKTQPLPVLPTPTPSPSPAPSATPEISPIPQPSVSPGVISTTPIPLPSPGQATPIPVVSPTPQVEPSPTPAPQLVIDKFTPVSGRVGSTLTITGSGFGQTAGIVKLGGVAMVDIKSWSDSQVQVVVSVDALSGKILITTSAGDSILSNKSFKLLRARLKSIRREIAGSFLLRIAQRLGFGQVAGVAVDTLLSGEQVVISGEDLGDGKDSRLTIGGVDAQIVSWNDSEIRVKIPEVDPQDSIGVRAILPQEESNELLVKVSWPAINILQINRYFALVDRETEINISGEGFLTTSAKRIKIKIGDQTVDAQVSTERRLLTFKIPQGLAGGEYSIVIVRGDGTETSAGTNFLITKPGDLWKPNATGDELQVRDGKVTIEDVSKFLSTFWQKNDAQALLDGDINFGPGDVSRGKVDIYDLNKIMANWDEN